jgi:hypothetical protein
MNFHEGSVRMVQTGIMRDAGLKSRSAIEPRQEVYGSEQCRQQVAAEP